MKLADGLRKHGFSKWYERELLQSHAHMALAFACLVGVFAAFEALSRFRGWADQLTDIAAIGICVAVGAWALRRYLFLLMHAEAVAGQADCPDCGTYARFKLVRTEGDGQKVCVACRKCSREWSIND